MSDTFSVTYLICRTVVHLGLSYSDKEKDDLLFFDTVLFMFASRIPPLTSTQVKQYFFCQVSAWTHSHGKQTQPSLGDAACTATQKCLWKTKTKVFFGGCMTSGVAEMARWSQKLKWGGRPTSLSLGCNVHGKNSEGGCSITQRRSCVS